MGGNKSQMLKVSPWIIIVSIAQFSERILFYLLRLFDKVFNLPDKHNLHVRDENKRNRQKNG